MVRVDEASPAKPTPPPTDANPTASDPDGGCTPLFVAARGGDVSIVNMLLAKSANPTTRNLTGWTPLHACCRVGSLEIARELIHRGADAYGPDKQVS